MDVKKMESGANKALKFYNKFGFMDLTRFGAYIKPAFNSDEEYKSRVVSLYLIYFENREGIQNV